MFRTTEFRTCVFLVILVFTLYACEARRFGGGGRRGGGSRWGSRRTGTRRWSSYSRPSSYHNSRYSSSRGSHPVTWRPRVAMLTAGPDISFDKVTHGQNSYQLPPTLQPLYPRQAETYSGSYHQPPHVIVNQPIYASQSSYYGTQDNSLLGAYLGYKIGSSMHNHNYNSDNDNNYRPRYAVVHHYHHYDQPIPKEIQVERTALGKCGNLAEFCTPNTTALCMTNGTLYCLTTLENTEPCMVNSTTSSCVHTEITIPCANHTTCDSTTPNITTISMPCISNMTIQGYPTTLTTNKPVETTEATTEARKPNFMIDWNALLNSARYSPSRIRWYETQELEKNSSINWETVLSDGTTAKIFCVTIIVEPLPVTKELTNGEFPTQLRNNSELESFVNAKDEDLRNSLIKSVLF